MQGLFVWYTFSEPLRTWPSSGLLFFLSSGIFLTLFTDLHPSCHSPISTFAEDSSFFQLQAPVGSRATQLRVTLKSPSCNCLRLFRTDSHMHKTQALFSDANSTRHAGSLWAHSPSCLHRKPGFSLMTGSKHLTCVNMQCEPGRSHMFLGPSLGNPSHSATFSWPSKSPAKACAEEWG
jgi:hypothetical protein